jgi:hypothetical protein
MVGITRGVNVMLSEAKHPCISLKINAEILRGVYPEPLHSVQGRSQVEGERAQDDGRTACPERSEWWLSMTAGVLCVSPICVTRHSNSSRSRDPAVRDLIHQGQRAAAPPT